MVYIYGSHGVFIGKVHWTFSQSFLATGRNFNHCHRSVSSSVPTNQEKQKLQTSRLLSKFQLHHLYMRIIYVLYSPVPDPILLVCQNMLSRNSLNSITLLAKFNGSLNVSYNFHLKITNRCIKVWRSNGEIVRNRSKELFCFLLPVLPFTSPLSKWWLRGKQAWEEKAR